MKALERKLIIFTTKKKFNDMSADDMKSGDIDAEILKRHYHLGQVSKFIDWITYGPSYKHPYTNFISPLSKEKAITMLYDELRSQSYIFSLRGPYKRVITDLFNHMQYNDGRDYKSPKMDSAYKDLILSDNSDSSTLKIIKGVIESFHSNKNSLTKEHFSQYLDKSRLPKYTRWKDCFNGMGVAVHDVNSTEISIEHLSFQGSRYEAVIKYKAQDHFGLDKEDILKTRFNAISFF